MFTVSAAHFDNPTRMTGRKEIGSCPKKFATEETAIKSGIPLLVKKTERDGKNFVIISGPNGYNRHMMV